MRTLNALQQPRPGLFWVCAAALWLAGCSRPEPPSEPIRAVKLLTVGAKPLHAQLEYAGEVRARTETRLGFRVGGKVLKRQAELGQRVRAGQVLAQLDPQDYRLAAQAAQAQVVAAQTQRDLAAADYQRYATLKAQNFISGAELERREASVKSAQAQLDQARAQASAEGNQTGYTQLLAPAAGVVTAVEAEPGQVVAAGAPVVRIAEDGPRDVVFAVPEDKVAQMATGQEVSVRAWSGGEVLAGKVREVAASADPVTRTYEVKVALQGEGVPALGSTVYVLPQAFNRTGTQAITLPTTALRQQGQGTAVWVYDPASSTVRSQDIEVTTADGNAAVVSAGLTPGMQVVATGVHLLSPGQKVTVYQQKGTQTPASQALAAPESIAPVAPAAAAEPVAKP